jgi:hypothetical protein
VSVVVSLRSREADWLEARVRDDSSPEAAAIREKLGRRRDRLPAAIPGQTALGDYPEVFSDAA